MTTPILPFIAYDNRFADALPVASSTVYGAAINLSDFRPYSGWKPVSLPATVTVDCGVAKSADKLAVFNNDLFSKAATIEVRGSTDNFVASDVLVHSYTPTSDKPFVRDFVSVTSRYWRIRLTGTLIPTLTIVALGVGMEFPVGLPYGFDPLSRQSFGQTNNSEQGLPLGKVTFFEQWAQALTFEHVPNAWLRNTFLPAYKAALRDNPFLFAHDLTNYPNEIYLVEVDGTLQTPNTSALRHRITLNVKGIALP